MVEKIVTRGDAVEHCRDFLFIDRSLVGGVRQSSRPSVSAGVGGFPEDSVSTYAEPRKQAMTAGGTIPSRLPPAR